MRSAKLEFDYLVRQNIGILGTGGGGRVYKTSLLPTEADKDSWFKEKVQFCKILSFELTRGEFLVSFSDPILSGVYLSVFLYNFLIFDFFRTNFNKFLHKARN